MLLALLAGKLREALTFLRQSISSYSQFLHRTPLARSSPSSIDDRQLIQAGYRYALSLTHHPEEAEDLVQHACLKAIRSKGQLVGKSYLFVAIRNLFYDMVEKQKPDSIDQHQLDAFTNLNEGTQENIDRRLDLDDLLGYLRPEEREAIYLNCIEGYTAAEIGKLTGRPRGTVLSLISRAKKRLLERHQQASVSEVQS